MAPATLTLRQARRLALARSGLLKPALTGLPARARGGGRSARAAAHAIIDRFGYLQLDTISIAGARSHALVLLSRLEGIAPELGESLLQPGAPLFEYWGHEASWLPIELYPLFEFRRTAFRSHPWWGDVIGEHKGLVRDLLRRIEVEGPLRSIDLEGEGSTGWWEMKPLRRVATALWSSGELAIRERRGFQRSYDLVERVIPAAARHPKPSRAEALPALLERALGGHGWARTGTLAQTFRLRNLSREVVTALEELRACGHIVACAVITAGRTRSRGWIRPADLELAAVLDRLRPRADQGVLLSPFDPLLWDRARVRQLFGFEQLLEVFKPARDRAYGYFCLPVLAGERLVARVDLKADRSAGFLRVLHCHFEGEDRRRAATAIDAAATRSALARYARGLGLELRFARGVAPP